MTVCTRAADTGSRVAAKPARASTAVRGRCPVCGDELVSLAAYAAASGYLIVWECVQAGGENPACDYRRVL